MLSSRFYARFFVSSRILGQIFGLQPVLCQIFCIQPDFMPDIWSIAGFMPDFWYPAGFWARNLVTSWFYAKFLVSRWILGQKFGHQLVLCQISGIQQYVKLDISIQTKSVQISGIWPCIKARHLVSDQFDIRYKLQPRLVYREVRQHRVWSLRTNIWTMS